MITKILLLFVLLIFAGAEPSFAENAANAVEVSVSSFPLLAFSGIFFLLFAIVYIVIFRKSQLNRRLDNPWQRYANVGLWCAIVLGFGVRMWIGVKSGGYSSDLNAFQHWAVQAANGLNGFYDNFANVGYPPGYIYVLAMIGIIGRALSLGMDSTGFTLLIKLPAIIADLFTVIIIYRLSVKRLGADIALGLAVLYAFNPAVIINSAAWGQMDSFFTLFILFALLLLVKGKQEWATVIYAAALLIKPQAIIFAPIWIFVLLQMRSWKRSVYSALAGVFTFVLLILPFSAGKDASWISKLYHASFLTFQNSAMNAFNLFALTGGNGLAGGNNRLVLPYSIWGILFTVLIVAFAAYLFFRSTQSTPAKLYLIALVLIAAVFVLTAKMHERYLYSAIPLALLSYIHFKDRRLLQVFLGFSLTLFINTGDVLAYSRVNQAVIPAMDGLLMFISLTNVGLLVYLIYIAVDMLIKGRVLEIAAEEVSVSQEITASPIMTSIESNPRLTRRDWVWMVGLTLVYAVIALYHLGAMNAPQTDWKPDRSEQSFYVDLGASRQIERVNMFGGIGDGKIKLEFSNTTDNWLKPKETELSYRTVFKWVTETLNVHARYVKVTVVTSGFTLKEMAFFEKDKDAPIAIQEVHAEGMRPSNTNVVSHLFDEQSIAKHKPSYMDSTYFDEIYHARTAFEHLHLLHPYENTHPPLGKLLISVGIYLFGMNPFGWRIVGTLFGIGMVPLMYVFGKRLFRKTEYAFIASFLMTFDFMHFAQTRIATIDVYGVFFIIVMYYYMFRYYSLSFYKAPLRQTLLPLFMSGLFFGIGSASKWIAIYGGAGLAMIFLLSLYDRYKEYELAKIIVCQAKIEPDHAADDKEEVLEYSRHIVKVFSRYSIKTMAWSSLFFIVIPIVVYSLSFVPIMASPGEKHTVKQLVQYQKDMYDYHSKLKATHPFSSQWYEWPEMVRPIWYYSDSNQPKGQASTIVSMGNPAIWWLSVPALLAALVMSRKRKDKGMFVILIAFLSQYVPWILVSRMTFIYHYFAMVPFSVLCITYVMKNLFEQRPSWRRWGYMYLAVVLLLFILFYPALSGLVVPKWYIDYVLRWFPSWSF